MTIGNNHFNTICYGDDILLCSTSVTGLQELNSYGLHFNPDKTTCMVMGCNPFTTQPQWSIDNIGLKVDDSITFLGTVIRNVEKKGKAHCENRIRAATKSFYGLQSAGIKYPGVDPEGSIKIYESAIPSVITYACASVNISTTNLKKLDKLQCTIVKQCLGLSKFALNTPLLQAVGILPISRTVELNSLDLLKQCFSCESLCKDFYRTILNTNFPGTLISRVKTICKINGINLLLYTLNDKYEYSIKCFLFISIT